MKKFLILHDNRGYLAMNLLPGAGRKVNLHTLKSELEKAGHEVEIQSLHDLKFPSKYKGWYVVYPSSEDPGLFYKDYIENVILQLFLDGAILLPRFELFHAHHNKGFMELQRGRMSAPYQTIQSRNIHFIDELEKLKIDTYPVVIKTSEGSGSVGVSLARNEQELRSKVKKMGRVTFRAAGYTIKEHGRHMLGILKRRLAKENVAETPFPRANLIIQNFIPGLDRDYKVLVFGSKYYLLRRDVRDHDFRASGSGKLSFPEEFGRIEREILSFAKRAYEELDSPMLSIDVAHDGKQCHMIEFQCLNFGPYTLQFSKCFYQHENGEWIKVQAQSVLEKEMVNAWLGYIGSERGM